jgi:hypothetical protein
MQALVARIAANKTRLDRLRPLAADAIQNS